LKNSFYRFHWFYFWLTAVTQLAKIQGFCVAAMQLFIVYFFPPWACAQGCELSPIYRLFEWV
jgi:hypothetical protein